MNRQTLKPLLLSTPLILLTACGGDSADNAEIIAALQAESVQAEQVDHSLRQTINTLGLTGDPSNGRIFPAVSDPLPQLGSRLFFSKSLGGEFSAACVTCHHPRLGGGDSLVLPVGVDALDADLLGPGREHQAGAPPVPRNSPTTFNIALWDRSLFHDSRVESLAATPGQNGAGAGIRTPDSAFGNADPAAGANLATAQARFPVTSDAEMRGHFLLGQSNAALRDRLAQRLGDYGAGAGELPTNNWLPAFQQAFSSLENADQLITFDNIALAIAEYERSQVFVDTPWRDYAAGMGAAISDSAKRGALLFLTSPSQGGAGCVSCHTGDFFTDELHHVNGYPQLGVGKGNGVAGSDDFGRERESGDTNERYAFRTPSLLNVSLTAPYGHAGAYATLRDVVEHYADPRGKTEAYFAAGGWCTQEQFSGLPNCDQLYPNARSNTALALDQLDARRAAGDVVLPVLKLSERDKSDLVAFLQSLTDRCAADAVCIEQWVPPRDGGPDNQQLNGRDATGTPF